MTTLYVLDETDPNDERQRPATQEEIARARAVCPWFDDWYRRIYDEGAHRPGGDA